MVNLPALKPDIIKQINDDPLLQGIVASAAGVKNQAVYVWLQKKQYDKFLNLKILYAIAEYLKTPHEDLLEKEVA